MAVIFAIVGGGAVVGIATTDTDSYSDYSNYSYGDYSDYSDAAERRRRRMEQRKREIKQKTKEVNDYKITRVNDHLESETLKEKDGAEVSVGAVRRDGNKKIKNEEYIKIKNTTAAEEKELEEIDRAIEAIDHVLDKSGSK